ncbi:Lipase [Porphyridium purpureum]|uniref:Lipase n=1 Tax=Porphyridium purpureum TaxID=35688 RepID=A0A5J4YRJ2_PORPP|nr:Lipase [Porphyridium purpureum]|eukprot:POR1831..scf296_7
MDSTTMVDGDRDRDTVGSDEMSGASVHDAFNDSVFEQLAGLIDESRVQKFGSVEDAPPPGVVLSYADESTDLRGDGKPIVFKYRPEEPASSGKGAAPVPAALASLAKQTSIAVSKLKSMSQHQLEYIDGEEDSDLDDADAAELESELEQRGGRGNSGTLGDDGDAEVEAQGLVQRFSQLTTRAPSLGTKKSLKSGDGRSGSGGIGTMLLKGFSREAIKKSGSGVTTTPSVLETSDVSEDLSLGSSEYGTTQAADEAETEEELIARQSLLLPPGFSRDEATLMVEFTSAAYCRVHNSSMFECGCGTPARGFEFTGRYSDAKTDASGFVGRHSRDKYICAGFRGTVSMKNWVNNVKAAMIDANKQKSKIGRNFASLPNDVKLHLGFFRSLESIGGDMVDEVMRLHREFPSDKVYVTGHSLGGAMSTHFALALVLAGLPAEQLSCYTFGQPRVGNDAFRREFDARIKNMFRIVNNYDVVPHLPQYATGFRHVGHELWFSSKLTLAQRKALLIKNMYEEHPRDKVEIAGLMDACANTIPFSKLGIVDHLLYYDRITGTHRLRGAGPPVKKVKPDGRIETVSDAFWMDVFDPSSNVLLWEYSLKSAKTAKNKAPFQQLIEYSKKLALEDGINWHLKVVQINTAVNDLPKQYLPVKGQDTTVYFKPPSSWPPPPPILLDGPVTFESLKAMVETYYKPPLPFDPNACSILASRQSGGAEVMFANSHG